MRNSKNVPWVEAKPMNDFVEYVEVGPLMFPPGSKPRALHILTRQNKHIPYGLKYFYTQKM